MTLGQLNGEVRSSQERNQGERAFKVTGKVKASRERGEKVNCVHGMAKVTMAGTSWRSGKNQAMKLFHVINLRQNGGRWEGSRSL